jgi:peroxiredoxin
MLYSSLAFLAFIPLSLVAMKAEASPAVGKPAPDFTSDAVDGSKVTLSGYKGKVVVLEWNNPGCPFVHKHYDSGNMQQLQSWATGKGVVWLTINSSAPGREGHMDTKLAKDYIARDKLAATHYVIDEKGTIGHLYDAKTTPHMFVVDTKGNIAYMGAIDDKPTPSRSSIEGADNYVKDAVNELLAGKPVAVASTQSYGCSVKYGD